MKNMHLRPMETTDIAQVIEIEKEAFSEPWSESAFQECLQAAHCWVLEQTGVICAYGVMSVETEQAHILNLSVESRFRRRGLGRRLVTHLLNQARLRGALIASLEVRPSNRNAVQLYKSMGFRPVGVSKDYYPAFQGREDALILAARL